MPLPCVVKRVDRTSGSDICAGLAPVLSEKSAHVSMFEELFSQLGWVSDPNQKRQVLIRFDGPLGTWSQLVKRRARLELSYLKEIQLEAASKSIAGCGRTFAHLIRSRVIPSRTS